MGIKNLVHKSDDPDGPFKTVGEVAEYFECHPDTIRRWGKVIGVPTRQMDLGESGKSYVWCYTQSDVDALELYSSTINPKGGRPKIDKTDP
jgi:hypothetical protein